MERNTCRDPNRDEPTFPKEHFHGSAATKEAILTVSVTGTFNVATGTFIASGPVTAATGKLTGATGTLVFDGLQDFATGKFVEDVNGVICVDLAR